MEAFLAVFRVLKSRLDYKNPLMRLPLVQMQTMQFIHEHGSATMKNLAEFLMITPPSATVLVENLAQQKYLHRLADKKDRRTIHLRLTAKGVRTLKQAMSEHCRRLEKILGKLTHNEQHEFIKLLSKMTH